MLDLVGNDHKNVIGTSIRISFFENGKKRNVFRDVNSGGSFGVSPLRSQIGIGQATLIEEIEINWHRGNRPQIFRKVKPNQFVRMYEGKEKLEILDVKSLNFESTHSPNHH
jgi:hypothetical protein